MSCIHFVMVEDIGDGKGICLKSKKFLSDREIQFNIVDPEYDCCFCECFETRKKYKIAPIEIQKIYTLPENTEIILEDNHSVFWGYKVKDILNDPSILQQNYKHIYRVT